MSSLDLQQFRLLDEAEECACRLLADLDCRHRELTQGIQDSVPIPSLAAGQASLARAQGAAQALLQALQDAINQGRGSSPSSDEPF